MRLRLVGRARADSQSELTSYSFCTLRRGLRRVPAREQLHLLAELQPQKGRCLRKKVDVLDIGR